MQSLFINTMKFPFITLTINSDNFNNFKHINTSEIVDYKTIKTIITVGVARRVFSPQQCLWPNSPNL